MNDIKTALLGLLGSKKAWALAIGLATLIVGRLGFQLDTDLCWQLFGLVSAYLVGQGIADHGKEAAQIAANVPTFKADTVVTLPPSTGAKS